MSEMTKDEFDAVLDHAFATTRQLHETLMKAGCIVVNKAEYDRLREDKARLDFLLGGGWVAVEDGAVRRYSMLHYKPTRAAIDAAILSRGEELTR